MMSMIDKDAPISNKWAYIEHKDLDCLGHVFPLNDLNDHMLSMKCWCCPDEDPLCPGVWVHNSADGREEYEYGTKLRS
jgi:hypothetical protein